MRWGLRRTSRVLCSDGGASADGGAGADGDAKVVVSALGSGMTYTLGTSSGWVVTLGGTGWYGDSGARAVVSAPGLEMTCTLRACSRWAVTLRGAGGDGSIIAVSVGVALLGCNGTAPIGDLLMVEREVATAIGRLRPLQRKDGGVCGAGAVAGGWVETLGFGRGVVTLGVGCIDGNGTFGVVIWAENISASWRIASIWGLETGANGDAGCECWSAAVKSFAASIAA